MNLFIIVLDRMTFDSKIATLERLLKAADEELFNKRHEKLFSELRFVKGHRNAMAHHIVNVFDGHSPIKQGVGFINYRDGAVVTQYDKGKVQQIIDRTNKCIEVIRSLILS